MTAMHDTAAVSAPEAQRTETQRPDLGTPERHARGELTPDRRVAFARARAVCECRLDWYRLRGYIDARQQAAGQRFRALHGAAIRSPRLVTRYAERVRGQTFDACAAQLEARAELSRLAALLDEAARTAVARVCGFDEYAGPGGVADLKRGLDRIAEHWGLPP